MNEQQCIEHYEQTGNTEFEGYHGQKLVKAIIIQKYDYPYFLVIDPGVSADDVVWYPY